MTPSSPGPLTVDALGRPCAIDLPIVIVDGPVRDRCPYIADDMMVDRTLDVSTPRFDVQAAMLEIVCRKSGGSGSLPASPLADESVSLIDYNAYWIQALYDYVLASGDVALAQQLWPSLVKLLDVYYPAHTRDGLFANDGDTSDYAFHRSGTFVAYYDAQYAFVLGLSSQLAAWVGDSESVARWATRSAGLVDAFRTAFWDSRAGAFSDTTVDPATHPEDAQAFAILAGLATPQQARSALSYLDVHEKRTYGNTVSDTDHWNRDAVGQDTKDGVYPFMTYFEVLARYAAHQDASALELIRREWGYMLHNGPRSTMWEMIGPFGGAPSNNLQPSFDAGWSSGAAPALTAYVLGVEPTSPGYATFTVAAPRRSPVVEWDGRDAARHTDGVLEAARSRPGCDQRVRAARDALRRTSRPDQHGPPVSSERAISARNTPPRRTASDDGRSRRSPGITDTADVRNVTSAKPCAGTHT